MDSLPVVSRWKIFDKKRNNQCFLFVQTNIAGIPATETLENAYVQEVTPAEGTDGIRHLLVAFMRVLWQPFAAYTHGSRQTFLSRPRGQTVKQPASGIHCFALQCHNFFRGGGFLHTSTESRRSQGVWAVPDGHSVIFCKDRNLYSRKIISCKQSFPHKRKKTTNKQIRQNLIPCTAFGWLYGVGSPYIIGFWITKISDPGNTWCTSLSWWFLGHMF